MSKDELLLTLGQRCGHLTFNSIPFDGDRHTEFLINPDYTPEEIICFEFRGMCIEDPFASENGMFEISPLEVYGIPADLAEKIKQHNNLRYS